MPEAHADVAHDERSPASAGDAALCFGRERRSGSIGAYIETGVLGMREVAHTERLADDGHLTGAKMARAGRIDAVLALEAAFGAACLAVGALVYVVAEDCR